jgi:serine/threonine-protein kinase
MNQGQALTQTGVSLGTPTYMSPEQAFAEKDIDGRSDEYSLACVLYEMLTGQPPFTGPNAQAIMARHSMAAVPSMQIVRNTIPDEVEDLVQRALAKSPADRFPTLGEFAAELKECVIDHATVTRRIDRRTLSRPVPKVQKKKPWVAIGLVAAGLVVVGFGAWTLWGKPRSTSAAEGGRDLRNVAVLYFDDLSSSGKLGYLAEGLTENLIDRLSHVTGLDVISKSGVAMFRGRDVSVDSIASVLSVGTLVRGTVEQDGERAKVSVRLVNGNSGEVLERAEFEQPLTNVLAAQDSLATKVEELLRKRVGNEVRLRTQRLGTSNATAWTLLQRAEKLRKDAEAGASSGDTAQSATTFSVADSLLAQAETMDPAWVDPIINRARVALSQLRWIDDPLHAEPIVNAGLAAANRAVAKAASNADALQVRGRLEYRKWQLGLAKNTREADQLLSDAERDLKSAVETDPTLADAWGTLSAVYNQKDQLTDAKLAAQKAYDQDAFLTETDQLLWRLYATSYDLEQFNDAIRWCEEGGRRFPAKEAFIRCRLWLLTTPAARQSNWASAWSDYDRLKALTPPQQWRFREHEMKMLVAAGLARAGLADSARRVLVSARGNSQVDPQGELYAREAMVRIQLGTPQDLDEVFKLLKSYFSVNPIHRKGFLETDYWWWRSIKGDPRFRQLVAG